MGEGGGRGPRRGRESPGPAGRVCGSAGALRPPRTCLGGAVRDKGGSGTQSRRLVACAPHPVGTVPDASPERAARRRGRGGDVGLYVPTRSEPWGSFRLHAGGGGSTLQSGHDRCVGAGPHSRGAGEEAGRGTRGDPVASRASFAPFQSGHHPEPRPPPCSGPMSGPSFWS